VTGSKAELAAMTLLSARRLRPAEALPWLAIAVMWFFFPTYLPLGTQILVMILFALSYDIVVGYAGILILGHTAFYGAGAYTAGLLAVHGWTEPISGLIAAGIVAAATGAVAGVLILRSTGLPLLILGLALTLLLGELANRFEWITGGHDGLQGIKSAPILGLYTFDFAGRTAFVYSAVVLFLSWIVVRALVNAPFGRSLVGIRQNPIRMEALGVPVWRRKLIAFTLSAGLAGVAGGLSTQTTQFVSLNVFGLELAGAVLVVLVVGGLGRLYGAFIGAAAYMVVQDILAKDDPVYWLFWMGVILICIVLIVPGGLLGVYDIVRRRVGLLWGAALGGPRRDIGRPR